MMGTVVSADLRAANPAIERAAVADATRWLQWVDDTFSTYKASSPVSRVGRGEMPLEAAPFALRWVLSECEAIRRATTGYFDVRATGTLDPSGFVKGWAFEHASQLLVQAGVANHSLNAGGDVRFRGTPGDGRRWRAGVAHPLAPGALCAVVELDDEAIATSGTAERGGHVIDPLTSRPAVALASVTVIAADLTTADVTATAALAMGTAAIDWLSTLERCDAYVIDATGHEWDTPGFARRRLDLRAA
jgi:thiamine biosynthesis lipoprotein